VPADKWLKEGKEYTIIFATVVLPQKTLAIQIDEIDLDETCRPYSFFLANRFAFRKEDLERLIEFIEQCTKVNLSIKELMSQTETLDV
jgi:hypothetical protein